MAIQKSGTGFLTIFFLGDKDARRVLLLDIGLLFLERFTGWQGLVLERDGLGGLHGIDGFVLCVHFFSCFSPLSPNGERGWGEGGIDRFKQKRPSQSWDGRGIRGATQVKLVCVLTKIPVVMQRDASSLCSSTSLCSDYALAL